MEIPHLNYSQPVYYFMSRIDMNIESIGDKSLAFTQKLRHDWWNCLYPLHSTSLLSFLICTSPITVAVVPIFSRSASARLRIRGEQVTTIVAVPSSSVNLSGVLDGSNPLSNTKSTEGIIKFVLTIVPQTLLCNILSKHTFIPGLVLHSMEFHVPDISKLDGRRIAHI
jgi:hypothetical protein